MEPPTSTNTTSTNFKLLSFIHNTHQNNHHKDTTHTYTIHNLSNNTYETRHYTQNKTTTLNVPITTITYIGTKHYITHLQHKTPKTKTIKYYVWNNSTIILLSGDIQTNPGPPPHTIKDPPKYTQRQRQYFTQNSFTTKSQYRLLGKLLDPYITHTTHSYTQWQKLHFIHNTPTPKHQYTHPEVLFNHHLNHYIATTSTYHNYYPTYTTHMPLPYSTIKYTTPPTPQIKITTHIGNIRHTTHTHLRTPKNKTIRHYIWNNSTIILLSGDIQINPGPFPHILKNLPK